MIKTLLYLAIFFADIWAIVQLFKSSATSLAKVLWALLILIFPVGGLLIWYLAGPGNKKF